MDADQKTRSRLASAAAPDRAMSTQSTYMLEAEGSCALGALRAVRHRAAPPSAMGEALLRRRPRVLHASLIRAFLPDAGWLAVLAGSLRWHCRTCCPPFEGLGCSREAGEAVKLVVLEEKEQKRGSEEVWPKRERAEQYGMNDWLISRMCEEGTLRTTELATHLV